MRARSVTWIEDCRQRIAEERLSVAYGSLGGGYDRRAGVGITFFETELRLACVSTLATHRQVREESPLRLLRHGVSHSVSSNRSRSTSLIRSSRLLGLSHTDARMAMCCQNDKGKGWW